ncbi:uncharacterized protein B0H18DRAFT_1116229 [Fomitopsis serialis]|uniref:uncharacterized protein n=1 Tax=Fomitopsis serialis TaxID=139415 RepID=UPI0020079565|nr:uncharacterized protein B0H18DRAFT_1116229 [Neoantrodia serialis]KAH9931414.1 hypothetical protein B0H18DRAFT_1116229 [Neoantrodia serialis]
MSGLQPSLFPPPPDDNSHSHWDADGHIDVSRSSVDEQDVNGSSASGHRSDDDQSEEESDTDEWRPTWGFARVEGTLPLALSARIPLEVFMLIIDAIRHQPTLAAVALVCALWYPRAMRNLYHTVQIRDRTSFNMLFKHCHASPRVRQWLASTCTLVTDEQDNLAYCTGYLDRHSFEDDDADEDEEGSMEDSDEETEDEDRSIESPQHGNKINTGNHFLQALSFALAGLMPRVRTLRIRNARLRFIRPDFFVALSRFKSVQSLTLWGCRLNNPTQLWRIVSAFPQLTDLTIDVRFSRQAAASYAGASLIQAPSHIRLRYLNIMMREERMAIFVDWMTHSGLCTSLADLKLRAIVNQFLREDL